MAVNFERIQNILKIRKLTLFGYLRQQEKVNDLNITQGIFSICLLFYASNFIEELIDSVYGNDDEWISQQNQIKDYFRGQDAEFLRKMQKINFLRKLQSITNENYRRRESLKLFDILCNSLTKVNPSSDDLSMADTIITVISAFQDWTKEQIRNAFVEENINPNSWSTPNEANQFLRRFWNPTQLGKVVTTFFHANFSNFVNDLFALFYENDKPWMDQQKEITDYFDGEIFHLSQINRREFARKIASITNLSMNLSGNVYSKLKSGTTVDENEMNVSESALIIKEIAIYRKMEKENILFFCIESNVFGVDDWSTLEEAEEFLWSKSLLSKHKKNIIELFEKRQRKIVYGFVRPCYLLIKQSRPHYDGLCTMDPHVITYGAYVYLIGEKKTSKSQMPIV